MVGIRMPGFGARVISEDLETEEITQNGVLTARKNLKAKKIEVNGPLVVNGTLEITTNGILKVRGPIKIGEDLIGEGDCDVNGPLLVKGRVGINNLKLKGPLETDILEARNVRINGRVAVNQDLIASESISIDISKETGISVGGVIEAPVVTLKARPIFNIAKFVFRVFGLKSRHSRVFVLTDLRINADVLQLDGVRVEGENNIGSIEYL